MIEIKIYDRFSDASTRTDSAKRGQRDLFNASAFRFLDSKINPSICDRDSAEAFIARPINCVFGICVGSSSLGWLYITWLSIMRSGHERNIGLHGFGVLSPIKADALMKEMHQSLCVGNDWV